MNSPRKDLPLFPLKALQALCTLAFAEDEGTGDVTSEAVIEPGHRSRAYLLAKESGVLAGAPCVEAIFRHRGLAPRVEWACAEGEDFKAGQVLARFEGGTRDLLLCERIILNFLQRFCGIATTTRKFAEAAGPSTKILDTRKTLPGYRLLDKYAVVLGGGVNHRQGLFDRVLIKDNHSEASGSARAAVDRVIAKVSRALPLQVEVRNLDELETLLETPVDSILLDNMSDEDLQSAVERVRAVAPHIKLEASGGMDLPRVRRLRDMGLDFISVGALTHSVQALDLSLKIGTGPGEVKRGRK